MADPITLDQAPADGTIQLDPAPVAPAAAAPITLDVPGPAAPQAAAPAQAPAPAAAGPITLDAAPAGPAAPLPLTQSNTLQNPPINDFLDKKDKLWNEFKGSLGFDVTSPVTVPEAVSGASTPKTLYTHPDDIPTPAQLATLPPKALLNMADANGVSIAGGAYSNSATVPPSQGARGPVLQGPTNDAAHKQLAYAVSAKLNDDYRAWLGTTQTVSGAPARLLDAGINAVSRVFTAPEMMKFTPAPQGRTAPESERHATARRGVDIVDYTVLRPLDAAYQAARDTLTQLAVELGASPLDQKALSSITDGVTTILSADAVFGAGLKATQIVKKLGGKAYDAALDSIVNRFGAAPTLTKQAMRGSADTILNTAASQAKDGSAGALVNLNDDDKIGLFSLRTADKAIIDSLDHPAAPTDVLQLTLKPAMTKQIIEAFETEMNHRSFDPGSQALPSQGGSPGGAGVLGAPTVRDNVLSVLGSIPTDGEARTPEEVIKMTSNPEFNRIMMTANDIGMSVDDLMHSYGKTVTDAARVMQQQSMVMRSVALRALAGDPEAIRAANTAIRVRTGRMAEALRPDTFMSKAMAGIRGAGNVWRALLLASFRVLTRNAGDTNIRIGLDTVTRAANYALQRTFLPEAFPEARGLTDEGMTIPGGPPATLATDANNVGIPKSGYIPPPLVGHEFGRMLGDLMPQVIRNQIGLGPSTRDQVNRIIAAFPKTRQTFSLTLGPDVRISPAVQNNMFVRTVTAMHTFQELIYRRAIFAVEADRQLRAQGSSLEHLVDHQVIPGNINTIWEQAQDKALKYTYGKNPRVSPPPSVYSGALFDKGIQVPMAAWANLIDKVPGLVVLDPFPRMLFNIMDYITDFMPTGGLRLLSQTNRAKISSGDYSPIMRELLGHGMLATALAFRQGLMPGLKPGPEWSQAELPDGKQVDIRPYAALAPFIGLADLLLRARDGRFPPNADLSTQVMQMALSYRPQAGVYSQATTDALNELFDINTSLSDKTQLAKVMLGRIMGGFATPLSTLNDFRAEFDQSLRLQRENTTDGIWGGIFQEVDPAMLPQKESAERGATPQSPMLTGPGGTSIAGSVLNQLLGLQFREAPTSAERVLDYLGFTPGDLAPKTGDRKLDAVVRHYEGPYVEAALGALDTIEGYQRSPVKVQMALVQSVIDASRKLAIQDAARVMPAAAALQKALKGMSAINTNAVDVLLRQRGISLTDIVSAVRSQYLEQEYRSQGQ